MLMRPKKQSNFFALSQCERNRGHTMPAAINRFSTFSTGLDSPPTTLETVTPSDSVFLAQVCRAVYVGVGGDVAVVVNQAGADATFVHKNVPSGTYLLGLIHRVNATNTTATNMIAVS